MASPVLPTGEAHGSNATPFSEHSKVEPSSLAEKVKAASVLSVVASGPESMVVSGAVVSAGVGVAVGGAGVSVGVGVPVGSGEAVLDGVGSGGASIVHVWIAAV
jgi:hypothetical protein